MRGNISVELEEISERRDYKLTPVMGCYICFNKDNPLWHYVTLLQHYGINQKCLDGHITIPQRKCSRCGTNYGLGIDKCVPCEERVENIILHEKIIENKNDKIELIKHDIRKGRITQEDGDKTIKNLQQEIGVIYNEYQKIVDSNTLTLAGEITRQIKTT